MHQTANPTFPFKFVCAVLGLFATSMMSAVEHLPPAGWGIDGRISVNVKSDEESEAFTKLLQVSGVRWVREGDFRDKPVIRARWQKMQAAGLHLVEVSLGPSIGRAARKGNQLPENLLDVYRASYQQAYDYTGILTVWELPNEPDMGFIKDLPERLTAFNKAMYLGLHDGAAAAGKPTTVLMSALALPPGPWLERATANGMLDYADAANIHFYGLARDMDGVIATHRAFIRKHVDLSEREHRPARRLQRYEAGWRPVRAGANGPHRLNVRRPSLPIWITECGVNMVADVDFYDPVRRDYQRDYTVETALRARHEPDVAVYMPYVLVHKDDGYAMTESPTRPLPVWTAYERLTRNLTWPQRTMTRPPLNPSRLVLQWLPDEGQGRTHKIAGTYRFEGDEPITGVVRLYNLGTVERRGCLRLPEGGAFSVEVDQLDDLRVPSMEMIEIPVVFTPKTPRGYFREECRAAFVPTDGGREAWPVVFGLERLPVLADFNLSPLEVAPAPSSKWKGFTMPTEELSSSSGPWRGRNGVEMTDMSSEVSQGFFRVTKAQTHPFQPPTVAVRLKGLPKDGLLLVRSNMPFTPARRVRVDLFDDRGQRFTQWENGGMDYHGNNEMMWLSLKDFHIFFWGRATSNVMFDSSRIVEMQLRFYLYDSNDKMFVSVEVAQPKDAAMLKR